MTTETKKKPPSRAAIARDVLQLLAKRKLVPKTGDYFRVTSCSPRYEKIVFGQERGPLSAPVVDLKSAIAVPGFRCEVCGIVAMFVARVWRDDDQEYLERADRWDCDPKLQDVFPVEELDLIEQAFEMSKMDSHQELTDDAIEFGLRYSRDSAWMRAICENIIRYKRFRPDLSLRAMKRSRRKTAGSAKVRRIMRRRRKPSRADVARDALELLRMRKILPTSGEYFRVPVESKAYERAVYGPKGRYPGWPGENEAKPIVDLQTAIGLPGFKCEVCGLGALFVARVWRDDDFAYSSDETRDACESRLGDVFGMRELDLIESAFEQQVMSETYIERDEQPSFEQAVRFGRLYDQDRKRLVAICENVVQYRRFNPKSALKALERR